MIERELIERFFKQLKISLTNASVYFKNHPVLKKSLSDTYQLLEEITYTVDPFWIGITSDSLLVEKDYFKGELLYKSLAQHFHYRKVKKILFFRGVTIGGLATFIDIVSKPFKDIIKEEGIKSWLMKENVSCIEVEELDYSELLGSAEGEERKDIWKFIIERAYKKRAPAEEMKKLTDHFEEVLSNFSPEDLTGDTSLALEITKVLQNLGETDIDKFKQCSESFVKFSLDNRDLFKKEEIAKDIKNLLEKMDPFTLTETLWKYNFENKKFDSFPLEVFSQFLDGDKQKKVAGYLKEKFVANRDILNSIETREKLRELITSFKNKFVSPVYMITLSSLIREMGTTDSFRFNQKEIFNNYIYLLLNLLYLEEKDMRIELIIFNIMKNWEKIIELEDFVFIRNLLDILDKKIRSSLRDKVVDICKKTKKQIISSLEDFVLNNISRMSNEDFYTLSKLISVSTLGPNIYIERIMEDTLSVGRLVALFLQFFPDKLSLLFKTIRENVYTVKRAEQAINILKYIDTKESWEVMKYIFNINNPFIKIEIIRVIQNMSFIDEDFILRVLKNKSMFLKREILNIIVMKAPHLKKKAVGLLLNIFNPLGIRNNILIDNVRLIGNNNIREAKEPLERLGKRFYLFGRKALRKAIEETLETFREK